MESRQSGRADGRGWGGRGDSAPRRSAVRGDGSPESTGADARPHESPPGEPNAREAERRTWPDPAEDPALNDEDMLRGSGEAPWVRPAGPRAYAGERGGAPRMAPPLPDLSALLAALEGMRGMVPRELTSQVNALVRELLLTLRALIDWYLERLDGGPPEPEIEDIPID